MNLRNSFLSVGHSLSQLFHDRGVDRGVLLREGARFGRDRVDFVEFVGEFHGRGLRGVQSGAGTRDVRM